MTDRRHLTPVDTTVDAPVTPLADLPLFDDPDDTPSPLQTRFRTSAHAPDLSAFAVPPAKVRRIHPRPTTAAAPDATVQPPDRERVAVDDVDWKRVKVLRDEISSLPEMLGTGTYPGINVRHPSAADLAAGRRIIHDHVQSTVRIDMSHSRPVLDLEQQAAIEQALEDAIFGLGRLEALFANPRIENIEIYGYDCVLLEDVDGNLIDGPPVAESDADLRETLMKIASREGRPFSEAVPWMHLQLDGHARLAAVDWVTARPNIVIRRHRIVQITLNDLVERGTITATMASLLAALVRAGRSIVVAGAQGAGKTTLMRALCNELDRHEPIATFQDVEELFLAEMEGRTRVMAAESRPGSGEYTPDGRRAGEITLRQLIEQFFRMNRSRLIVGEVRGAEILAMIDAGLGSTGSLSTTHARDAEGAIDKLITCGMKDGAHITEQYMKKALAACVDVIVFLNLDTHGRGAYGPGKRDRYVTQILELGKVVGDDITTSDIYVRGEHGHAIPFTMSDQLRHELVRFGFNNDAYQAEAVQHRAETEHLRARATQ